MKQIFLTFVTLIGLISCNNTPMTEIVRDGEPTIYRLTDEDQDMNRAISAAKKTLETFNNAFVSDLYDTSTFALKVKVETANGNEHIWATHLTLENGQYFGIVDNIPDLTTKVKLGEKIKIDKVDISDWMFSDQGILIGGYTIRRIRHQMTEDERKKFDADFLYKIVD